MTLTPFDFPGGTDIRSAISTLLAARTPKSIPVAVFNGVVLVAYPDITAEEMRAAWDAGMRDNSARWRRSPAGQAAAAEEARRREEDARRSGEVRAFPLHAVLTAVTGRVWGPFGELRDLADWVGAHMDNTRVKVLAHMPTIPEGIDTIPEADWPTSPLDAEAKLSAQISRFGATIPVVRK